MAAKLLVAYATKTGTAESVAEAIADVLREQGAEVEVAPAGRVKSVADYQSVVLGTAIRAGRPLAEAVKFTKAHQRSLASTPVALFSVGLEPTDPAPESLENARSFLKPLAEGLNPVAIATFAGNVDASRLSWPLRKLMETIGKSQAKKKGEEAADVFRDFRDWDAIRAWAREIAPLLLTEE